ncbi:MAG TPA: ABC transporter ATP-binding protein [Methylomusa anaerophila]|uniref:Aliphatic sulfonates import ATP-binding protein SsuB n=1 Tax=Methylomusa anaerophila TaxID=1930071 RepID=A0A348AQI2_9FIRM|nr:ABC transporter ATP-binding protein [Methylomusa anaerophila]BBB93330.1 aliphatic sulfonates import ATP-binding protein SsuB [Methylomusa anaerophila]HML86839.1 ABC transporter ATP-binding protein [Methylomusa anaerophila]
MMAREHSIVLKEVGKVFRSQHSSVTALHNINLEIGSGEFFSIVGPSGCGKTTLLRILAGLETASGGGIEINVTSKDRPVNSMVFQEQSVFPWMTVIDNVAYGLRLRGVPKKERNTIATHYIKMIGLTNFAAAYPHQLSGGMKQRVSVARAFANNPEILLMDEPFGSLDEQNRIILQQELLKIWDMSKKTTVFITHSIDEALCLSDRIMIMTAHPGTVKTIIDIDLPRPRDISTIRTSGRYNELYQKIWLTLQEEVLGNK